MILNYVNIGFLLKNMKGAEKNERKHFAQSS